MAARGPTRSEAGSPVFRLTLLFAALIGVSQVSTARAEASSAPELFRLRLAEDRFLEAPIRFVAENLLLELTDGVGFIASASGQPTALVLIGAGRLRVAPPIRSEQRQLTLFCGSATLSESFDSVFLRFHPADFESLLASGTWRPGAGPEKQRRLGEVLFREEIGRSFALERGDPNASALSALPPRGDLLAEIRTVRLGRLAYARVGALPEDIVLLDRGRGRTIVSYPSLAHGSTSGLEYGRARSSLRSAFLQDRRRH